MYHGEEINKIDPYRITKAQQLFNYGISLIKIFTPWDKSTLPNPECYDEQDEFYVQRVNAVFVYAMNFILCHEFVHVEREHIDKLILGKASALSPIR
jgi:hypothetical protein